MKTERSAARAGVREALSIIADVIDRHLAIDHPGSTLPEQHPSCARCLELLAREDELEEELKGLP